jgi:hypothetical protein
MYVRSLPCSIDRSVNRHGYDAAFSVPVSAEDDDDSPPAATAFSSPPGSFLFLSSLRLIRMMFSYKITSYITKIIFINLVDMIGKCTVICNFDTNVMQVSMYYLFSLKYKIIILYN